MDDSDQECVPAFRFDLLPRRRSSLRDRSLRGDREEKERPRSRLNFKHIRVAQQEIGLLGNLSLAVQDGRERRRGGTIRRLWLCAVKTSKEGRSLSIRHGTVLALLSLEQASEASVLPLCVIAAV